MFGVKVGAFLPMSMRWLLPTVFGFLGCGCLSYWPALLGDVCGGERVGPLFVLIVSAADARLTTMVLDMTAAAKGIWSQLGLPGEAGWRLDCMLAEEEPVLDEHCRFTSSLAGSQGRFCTVIPGRDEFVGLAC